MTKLFCDRCKNEIKNRNTAHKFDFEGEWKAICVRIVIRHLKPS